MTNEPRRRSVAQAAAAYADRRGIESTPAKRKREAGPRKRPQTVAEARSNATDQTIGE